MSSKLGDYFGISEPLVYKGDSSWVLDTCTIGIEVEVENIRGRDHQPPHANGYTYTVGGMWALVSDGSLRNSGGEYVSRKLFGKDLTLGLEALSEHLKKKEKLHEFTHRTSVHIHLDVRDLTLEQLQKFLQLYCIFERPLFRVSGNRGNNEYCIPLADSQEAKLIYGNIVSPNGKFVRFFKQYGTDDRRAWNEIKTMIAGEFVKYMGLNLIPFVSKGSVEFRHHEGTIDIDRLRQWINIIFSLKRAALDYPFKDDPYIQLSSIGPMAMLESVFGDYAKALYYDGIEIDLWEGCRTAQDMILYTDVAAVHAEMIGGAVRAAIVKEYTDRPKEQGVQSQKPSAPAFTWQNMYPPNQRELRQEREDEQVNIPELQTINNQWYNPVNRPVRRVVLGDRGEAYTTRNLGVVDYPEVGTDVGDAITAAQRVAQALNNPDEDENFEEQI